jgi:hypothetical protein
VQAERFAHNHDDWLWAASKVFMPTLLKQGEYIIISTTLTHYIPLKSFNLPEEQCHQPTLLELENSLGDRLSSFNIAHIFLAHQTMIAQLNEVLASV